MKGAIPFLMGGMILVMVRMDVMGDVCEYPLARNIVMLAVAIASEEVVSSIAGQPRRNLSVTLGDLSVRELEIAV